MWLVVILFTSSLLAQSDSGSAALRGLVLDTSGSAVASAQVKATQKETGYQRTGNVGADGRYFIPVLPVGIYKQEVTANGFQMAIIEQVSLVVGDATSVEVRLRVADTSAVDPETTATSTTINQQAIDSLPVRGRNFVHFVQLTPGVMQESDRSGLVIAGQRSINSNVSIDGADFNHPLQSNQRGGN